MNCRSKTFACIAIAWLLLEAAVDTQARAQAAVNVRNFIPGIVDAPVYDVDGTTRLDNEVARAKGTYYASAVHAGRGLDQLFPLADPLLVGSGDHAGYWDTPSNDGVLFVPWATPGETVYLQFRVFEYRLHDAYEPERGPTIFEWGVSEVYQVDTLSSSEATPIYSLKSMKLFGRQLTIAAESENAVLQWLRPIGGGYVLENGTPAGSSVVWQTLVAEEDLPPHDLNLELVCFTNRVETPVSFYRLRRLWIPSGRGISGSTTSLADPRFGALTP